jgi:hypothetical protein
VMRHVVFVGPQEPAKGSGDQAARHPPTLRRATFRTLMAGTRRSPLSAWLLNAGNLVPTTDREYCSRSSRGRNHDANWRAFDGFRAT